MKSIYILGICGTFMGGLAILARSLGYTVTGSDQQVYPPMSTLLEEQGITVYEGYDRKHLPAATDEIVIGNVASRGNPVVEYLLDQGLPFLSGCEWLRREVLSKCEVLAVAGTHGKTTTTSILAWMLEYAGYQPGFLIGGVAENFGISARLGKSRYFVIEADEYDTAFFDKRSKFVHYYPKILIVNNIEFDHADIFDDITAIQRQFHHLIRIIPGNGTIIVNAQDENIAAVMAQGCWSKKICFATADSDLSGDDIWQLSAECKDFSRFIVSHKGQNWVCQSSLIGQHNALNTLAATIAAGRLGISPQQALAAMAEFQGVRRRLQFLGQYAGIQVYDDFAHHPTAIVSTLEALRAKAGDSRIIAVMEPRSNTMKLGMHADTLLEAFKLADQVLFYQASSLHWDILPPSMKKIPQYAEKYSVYENITEIINALSHMIKPKDYLIFMSNGGFSNIQQRFITTLGSAGD